jgi:hypothetical protein
VLRTLRADSTVTCQRVEAAAVGNVDDLTLTYTDAPPEYWQIKASVDATKVLDEAWLFEAPRDGQSLIQRLHASWKTLGGTGPEPPRIVLATTRAIDPNDPVLGKRATLDNRIIEAFRPTTTAAAEHRSRWARHLGIDEQELLAFLACLELKHGQSERDWREKVQDAAHGAGMRGDRDAMATGLQQVRDWVKQPRQDFTPATLATALDLLEMRVVTDRALMVLQALEQNGRAARAHYELDWVDLFDGDDPRSRRVLASPDHASRIMVDLAQARDRLRAAGLRHLEVDGPMRLPLWFIVGTQLSGTAGFSVAATVLDRSSDLAVLWSSTATPAPAQLRVAPTAEELAASTGRPWVVSVSVSVDIAEDVEAYRVVQLPDAVHVRVSPPVIGQTSMVSASYAVGFAFELRSQLRVLARSLCPPEVHLFLAMPGAAALILGSAWDRLPATRVYWDLGGPSGYAPAFEICN